MWLPLVLLAFMASGSACPDLCECHQQPGPSDGPALVDVACRGRVPTLAELPTDSGGLLLDAAEEYEVASLLDELAATDSLDPSEPRPENATGGRALPWLDELAVTNCSLASLNASWRGLERVRSLNLSSNNLARLTDALPVTTANLSGLARLDLSANALTEIGSGTFATLSGLARLSLRRNAIATVDADAFRGLDLLEFLDLSDNRLADLPDSALTPLYSLQKLDLSGNQLQVLGARWFESLDRLRELDVSRNGLARAATGTLQPLPGLSVLRLAGNPLRERDVSLLLGTGRRLETVDASRTGLARVPAALTRSVRALRLAGNKLTAIRGGDLDSYPLLRMLDISDNRLGEIEEDALGRLEVLEELDVSGNALTKTPRSLPGSLTVLKLQRNSITALRLDDLQGLSNLRSLTLNDNDIVEIDVGSLAQLPALVELDLSDNPIRILPANALSGPSNLATLRMSGLASLRREQQVHGDMAFPVSTPDRLVVLDVSRSPVLAGQLLADDAALSACKSLLELDLSDANLTTLRSDLSYLLPQLRVLRLAGNEWNCTPDMYWLGEWTRQRKVAQGDAEEEQARCSEPDELAGSFLDELPAPPATPDRTVPTAANVSAALPVVTVARAVQRAPPSSEASVSVSSTTDDVRGTDFTRADGSTDAATSPMSTVERLESATSSPGERDGSANVVATEPNNVFLAPSAAETARVYEAPTSFRNITPPGAGRKSGSPAARTSKDHRSEWRTRATGPAEASVTGAGESHRETFDNRVGPDAGRLKSAKPSGVAALPGKMAFAGKQTNLGSRREQDTEVERNEEKTQTKIEAKTNEQGNERKDSKDDQKRRTAKKQWKKLNNKLARDNSLRGNGFDESVSRDESSGEANDRATDSGARVSEPVSAGAHPGMLVLAGAALGAAAALTVVLSRRATVRRRDRYHRHENIEVHTLTPTAELW